MAGGILTDKKDGALAYAIRRANFPDVIQFYAPGIKRYSTEDFEQKTPQAFRPVSLTGSACALNCDHCNTKILDPMIPLRQEEGLFNLCQRLAERGTKGILISGGSQHSGAVPLLKYTDDMARVKAELGLKVMVHCGVPDEKTCAALKAAEVDGVMLDIIGANETIRDVYHLNITVTDFERALENLVKHGLSVRPHIILGLHYGKFLGEYAALEMIQKYPVHALILVILTPLRGTPMENVAPTAVPLIRDFFESARIEMPDRPIMVGCSRPGGDHKRAVDEAAVDCGLNGIAYPAEGIVGYAKEKGLQPRFYENSCSCGC